MKSGLVLHSQVAFSSVVMFIQVQVVPADRLLWFSGFTMVMLGGVVSIIISLISDWFVVDPVQFMYQLYVPSERAGQV